MAQHGFPDGFLWGAATSAQQIEGGRHEGARGESIWDCFASIPGNIEDGSTPDIACDHYHRWREDIDLMKGLGLGGYRFSIAWPRILPAGRGQVNGAGLDFYDALVDGLLAAGIQPFPTLYHWDLPQALQNRGGWGERDTAEAFVEYSAAVTRRLGDRVSQWVTHNEPWCAATLGYQDGHHAPGVRDPAAALRAAHHLLLSHGWATDTIRREAPGAEVGIVLIHCPAHAASNSEADRDAARWFDGFFNRWYLDPVYRGSYPADAIADRVAAGQLKEPDLPFVKDGDLAAISSPLDFLGLNYYSRAVMKAGPDNKPMDAKTVPSDELTDMGWEVYPQGLQESLLRVHREYEPQKIYIAENGAAFDYPVDAEGRIADTKRVSYLREHLLAAHRAIADGVPLAGYFTWSLMDNFEWGYGYKKKFGLFAVDFATQERSPKDSALWYRDVVAANAVEDASAPTSQGEFRAFDP
jgi:beta-glucosidase